MSMEPLFELSCSHPYAGSSGEVRCVDVTFVDKGSCSKNPLEGVISFAVAVFSWLFGCLEKVLL